MARPDIFSEELAAEVCERIAMTTTLAKALEGDDMPGISTIMRWLPKHDQFREGYARAMAARTETDSEEMRRVAYDPELGADHKARILDTLKWQMARREPKKWGERHLVGSDPENPLPAGIAVTFHKTGE
jgi:hypothetical protein